jgi:hypothetical protein
VFITPVHGPAIGYLWGKRSPRWTEGKLFVFCAFPLGLRVVLFLNLPLVPKRIYPCCVPGSDVQYTLYSHHFTGAYSKDLTYMYMCNACRSHKSGQQRAELICSVVLRECEKHRRRGLASQAVHNLNCHVGATKSAIFFLFFFFFFSSFFFVDNFNYLYGLLFEPRAYSNSNL